MSQSFQRAKKGEVVSRTLAIVAIVFTLFASLAGFLATTSPAEAATDSEWTWQNPLPQGNTLYGVWGSSSSDVFAVGDHGTILHYNGSIWSAISSGITSSLRDIWGNSSSNVFAVGDSGTILRYDGSTWSAMNSGTANPLYGIWGSSSSDVFAVGEAGTILHYTGSTWSEMSSGTSNSLRDIWGNSFSNVFAVGDSGTILHYDGIVWSTMSSGTTYRLNGVWGSPTSDVFAVIDSGNVLYYDGIAWGKWSEINDVNIETPRCIWGSSSSDIFISSTDGMGVTGRVFYNNGSAWSGMDDPAWYHHYGIALYSIWGSSSSDVFAVGLAGTIFHYNGSTWSEMSSGTTNNLYGIWGTSDNDVFAIGTHMDFGDTIIHYDGNNWNIMIEYTTYFELIDVWGSSSSNVFAISPYGTIFHYDGSTWSEMANIGSDWLLGIWGRSSSDIFIVGGSGLIFHYDGSNWSEMSSGTADTLRNIWGSSSSDVFAIGDNGTILHYDGSNWSEMDSGTTYNLRGVWGNSSSNVFAVGAYGTVLHYDGSTWSEMSSGTSDSLSGVWGSSSSNVFAVGEYGAILHYDGITWSEMSSGTSNSLSDIWGDSSSDVFVVGDHGTVLRFSTAPVIASIAPDSGNQGETLDVIITGNYLDGAKSVTFGNGITVNSFTIDSVTQITANITIDADAGIGARDISVTTSGVTDTLTDGFIVNLTQITHDLTIAISGNGTTHPSEGPYTYNEGTVADISATPDSGWQFVNWTGGVADPNSPSTTVIIDDNKTVTANFIEIESNILARQTISPDSPATVNSDDGQIVIQFPAGSVADEAIVTIKRDSQDSIPSCPSGFKAGATFFSIEMTADLAPEAIVTITVKYSDVDLEACHGDPNKLTLSRYDNDTEGWVKLATTIDAEEMTLTAGTHQFSTWMVMASEASDGGGTVLWIWLVSIFVGLAVLMAIGGAIIEKRRRSSVLYKFYSRQ